MSALELIAVAASIAGIWLTTRRKVWCWPVVLLSTVLYGVVFYRSKLYSDMLLQGLFAAFTLYGWWAWTRGVKDEGEVIVLRISRAAGVAGLAAGAAGSAALGYAMARYTDASIPHVDAMLSSFSLVAQYWTTRRYIENWWLWIVVDIIYTAVFVFKELYLTAGLYAFLIFLAVLGLREWRAALAKRSAGRAPLAGGSRGLAEDELRVDHNFFSGKG
jgi:nicotinamide mononucleotide transporter